MFMTDSNITKPAVTFDEAVMLAEGEEQRLNQMPDNAKVTLLAKQPMRQKRAYTREGRNSLTCNFCKKSFHDDTECFLKHPQLRQAYVERREKKRQRLEAKDASQNTPQTTDLGALAYSVPQVSLAHLDPFTNSQLQALSKVYVLDSGATNNTFVSKRRFTNIRPYTGEPVCGLGGVQITPDAIGHYYLPVTVDSKQKAVILRDAYYSPKAGVNLVSASTLQRKNVTMLFHGTGVSASLENRKLFTATLRQALNLIDTWQSDPSGGALLVAHSAEDPSMKLWHERLGHLGYNSLGTLQTMSTGIRPIKATNFCDTCAMSTLHETPHTGTIIKGTYPFESLHIDVTGSFPHPGYDNSSYWLTIVDDFTGYTWAVPLIRKSDTYNALRRILETNEMPERRCRRIRMDLGGENISTETKSMLTDKAIECTLTGAEQHQSNGLVEVTHRILRSRLVATLAQPQLPRKYWPLVLQTVTYLKNISPSRRINKTPYEAWTGTKPDLNHLRVIGSRGHYLLPQQTRRLGHISKLELLGRPCRMVGYQGSRYKIILTDDDKIVITNNAFFNDHAIKHSLKR